MRQLLLSMMVVLAPLAASATEYNYDHNGSQMRVDVQGSQVRIYYERPRAGLRNVGVRPGTLLFDGRLSGSILEGMSRIFNANCGEVDYFVSGDFTPGRSFKLNGAAPVLSNVSCRIVNNVYDGPNANLQFTALGGARPAPKPPRPVQKGACVIGVNSTLNVRAGPGADYGRIAEIPSNSCGVRILSRCQSGWCAVRQGDAVGWVSMRYISR